MRTIGLTLAASAAIMALGLISAPVRAGDELPACASSGSANVMIAGRPAFRLSDLAGCPPELVEISPNVFVNGEPAAFLKTGKSGDDICASAGSANVQINGKGAQAVGDGRCVTP